MTLLQIKKPVVMCVLIFSMVAGCASDRAASSGLFGGGRELTPAEQRLRDDNRVFNETILGGIATRAIGGAIVGALLGALTGDARAVMRGAAIGGAIGGISGGIDGWRVAVRQEAARKRLREIDIATEEVLAENRKIQESISNMDAVISDTRNSLRNARQAQSLGTGSLDEVRRQEARTARNLELMDELIENHEDRLKEQVAIGNTYRREGQQTASIERDISETRALLERKKRERDLLEQELIQGTA